MNREAKWQSEVLYNLYELSGANPRHAFNMAEMESWGYEEYELVSILERLADRDLVRLSSITEDGIPLKAFITLEGIRTAELKLRRSGRLEIGAEEDALLIFVSHSSKDSDVALKVIELIRAALQIRSTSIRCTSLDGYRLPSGISTDERLRQEVFAAVAFVGIITPNSLKSPYVLFELGARWGAGRPLCPLLAKGATPEILGGPLANVNVLTSASAGQLHQMVYELASALDLTADAPASYQRYVDALVNDSSSLRQQAEPSSKSTSITEESLSNLAAEMYPDLPVARSANQVPTVLKHLHDFQYLQYLSIADIRTALSRTEEARAELAEINTPRSAADQIVRAMAIEHPQYISAAFPGKPSDFHALIKKHANDLARVI